MIAEATTALHPASQAHAWLNCIASLEAHSNPHAPEPYPVSTLVYAQVLWTLAECLGVKSVLEIGIGPHALSGMIFAHSMATRGGGVIYSVDNDTSRPAEIYREQAKALNVDWKIFHGDSLDLVNQFSASLQVDLLYVDGDHDYTHAYGDTINYFPFLRPGGYLVIDDYPGCDGVIEAKIALQKEGYRFVHLAHHCPHGNGRLLMQKPYAEAYKGVPI